MRATLPLVALLVLAGCVTTPAADVTPRENLTWSLATTGPTPRTEVVTGLVGSRIHVIGGFPLPAVALVDATAPATTLVEVYDIEADAWSRGPDYPLDVHHAAAVELDGALYVLGGMTGPAFLRTPLSFRLDDGAASWTAIAPLPAPRGSHTAAVLDGKIYVAGGLGAQSHEASVLVYDPATDAWTEAGDPIPTPRDHTAGGALGGRFCVAGGDTGGHGVNTDATECFDPATGAWSTHAALPTLRGSVAAGVWRERLVVVGGQNATGTFDTVEAFDLANESWEALAPLAQARHGFGVVVHEGTLYAVYGGPEPGLTATSNVERLRASTSG